MTTQEDTLFKACDTLCGITPSFEPKKVSGYFNLVGVTKVKQPDTENYHIIQMSCNGKRYAIRLDVEDYGLADVLDGYEKNTRFFIEGLKVYQMNNKPVLGYRGYQAKYEGGVVVLSKGKTIVWGSSL